MTNKTINIKATNFDLNDEVRKYVETRINSLDKFIDATDQDQAIFDVEVGKTSASQHTGNIFRAEINLSVHGKFYRTESTKDHLFVAVEEATNEMQGQLHRGKDKRMALFRKGAQKIKNIMRWGQ